MIRLQWEFPLQPSLRRQLIRSIHKNFSAFFSIAFSKFILGIEDNISSILIRDLYLNSKKEKRHSHV